MEPEIVLISERSQNMVTFPYIISSLVWTTICLIILALVHITDTNIKVTLSPGRINHSRETDTYI